MKILLCNERFLFRFGVDRVLMLLGKYFKDMGHEVIMMGNKLDEAAVETCTDDFIKLPEAPEYINSNEYTIKWLEENWNTYFNKDSSPDVAIIAGWPFYNSIKFLKDKCGTAIFHDYGAVPSDNMTGGSLIVQKKLKNLRSDNLQYADEIIAISKFLEKTQSEPDSKGIIPVSSILLGCDHMSLGLWSDNNLGLKKSVLVEEVEQLKNNGKKILFLLGRFEKENYKNSEASFNILRKIKEENKDIVMLTLAKKDELDVPNDLKENIKPLGFVSDDDLQKLMEVSDVGISVSLWEGFNLPLAEMQLLRRPVFVFNKGAHPEVVINEYYLCESTEEMVQKINKTLNLDNIRNDDSDYIKFKEFFTWRRCANEFIEKLIKIKYKDRVILIDVTNASHDTANSGVMRVTRKISRNIQERVQTIFVLWDSSINKYVFPYTEEIKLLSSYGGPDINNIVYRSKDGENRLTLDEVRNKFDNKDCTLLITETINENQASIIREYVKNKQIKVSAIFYDAIPVLNPEFCNEEVLQNHRNYMKGLAMCNTVIPISQSSGNDLISFWKENNIIETRVENNLLAGELEGIQRTRTIQNSNNSKIKLLCISTLEPRKNHKRLLNACMMLSEKYPNLNWQLDLVGNRYAGNDEIPSFVEKCSKDNPRIKWLGVVDDEQLINLYKECTFTVYPSIIEGYGMPIIESLWNGKVCICSNKSVMNELAKDGGCYTVDVTDEEKIMEAIYELATNTQLRHKLEQESISRYIRTWRDYSLRLLDILYNNSKANQENKKIVDPIKNILFNGIKMSGCTLNIGQQFVLTSMLEKISPDCSILIGDTKCEELASNYSNVVFSIDSSKKENIDKDNVINLNGRIKDILPIISDEVCRSKADINFIFMNEKIEVIKETFNILKQHKIEQPLFVIINCNYDKTLKKELSYIEWKKINNLKWIDLNFINTNSKENNDITSINGGLAIVCLSN
jgi:glycosyltransferase involved in cell wall biosynthesis